MYVIIRFHVKNDIETNVDVVNTYEDLEHYCDVLLQNDVTLKRVPLVLQNPRVGRCVPMAFNETYEYYVQYHQFVKEPSFV